MSIMKIFLIWVNNRVLHAAKIFIAEEPILGCCEHTGENDPQQHKSTDLNYFLEKVWDPNNL